MSDDTKLRVAHPFDLYNKKIWADWQQFFLERGEKEGVRQPFRQVFRELYVKLPEELDKDKSLLFAGNQISTSRTVGALKNRRWIADYEDGLQKVYYRDDIIASIYAVADWFSPSDIEAPVLEGVFFVNRRTYEPMKIRDIPDIVYSEVMRDVDLAVSVAHAGGVDPETSHSTVEMRKVILAFNMKLFGISNVTLDKNVRRASDQCAGGAERQKEQALPAVYRRRPQDRRDHDQGAYLRAGRQDQRPLYHAADHRLISCGNH